MVKYRLKNQGEISYIYATVLLAVGTVMMIKADFGMSMIAAPAYCLSYLLGGMMGFGEYIIQGVLLVLFCLIVRHFRWQYLLSFVTALLYGGLINLLQLLLSDFHPESILVRVVLFAFGIVITSFAVALYFNTYFPLSVYELFVKGLCDRYGFRVGRTKTIFDFSLLVVSILMALLVFGVFKGMKIDGIDSILAIIRSGGVYIGTVLVVIMNGQLVFFFDKILKKYVNFDPKFKKIYQVLSVGNKFEG